MHVHIPTPIIPNLLDPGPDLTTSHNSNRFAGTKKRHKLQGRNQHGFVESKLLDQFNFHL